MENQAKVVKEWTPNEVQAKFLAVLEAHKGEALTLAQISELAGYNFKSGSINVLASKDLVKHGDDVEVVVMAKRKVKTYVLA